MDREEYKARQFARNYGAGESTLGKVTGMKYIFYVVKNEAGEYLYIDTATDDRGYDLDYDVGHFVPIHLANIFNTFSAAENAAIEYGGTVKRVSITIEED